MTYENKEPLTAGVRFFCCDHPAIDRIGAYRVDEESPPRTRIDRVRGLVHAVTVLDKVLRGGTPEPWVIEEVTDWKGRLTVRWHKHPSNLEMKLFNIAWRILGEPVVEHVINKTGHLVARSTD